jgi:hypothetical protein
VESLEQEIFVAASKEGLVKALGVQVNCKLQDLRILVNGVDITRTVVLEEVRIVIEAKGE